MKRRLIALVIGALLVAPIGAQANPAPGALVKTPNGFLSPLRHVLAGQTFDSPSVPGGTVTVSDSCTPVGAQTCYLPSPNVPIPVVANYVDDTHEAITLGTPQGLALSGSLAQPISAPNGNCPGGGEYLVAVSFTGTSSYPGTIAQALLAPGTTDLTGSVLAPPPGGVVMTPAQVATLGWWDDDGLDVRVAPCDALGNPLPEDGDSYWMTSLVGAVVYLPNPTAGGDPWFKFRSGFKAETHLIVRRKSGKLVRYKDLGWLPAGAQRANFKCGTLSGTLYVHVYGKAHDGAAQKSPVRKVTC